MKKVAIVGVEGSGKTVLMAAMGEKYRKPRADGLFLYANSRRTIEYCNEQIDILRNQHKWPNSTSPDSLVNLEWTLMRRKKGSRPEEICTVAFLDYAGEIYRYAFGDSTDDSNQIKQSQYKKQIEAVKAHLKDAESVVVLVNLSDIINSNGVSMKASEMDWLSQRIFDFAFDETSANRVAIAFTQKDLYEETIGCCGGVEGAFEAYLPSVFYRHESEIVPFAVSAVNKTVPNDKGEPLPASDFESEGFDELVSWMANVSSVEPVDNTQKSVADKTEEFMQAWEDERYNDAAKLMSDISFNDETMYALATMYEHGRGVKRDDAEALKLYQKVIDWGAIAGGVDGKRIAMATEAVRRIEKAKIVVSGNNTDSMPKQEEGKGAEDATSKFLRLFQENHYEDAAKLIKLADKNDKDVQYALGYMYRAGEGLPKDRKTGASWLRKAAESGDVLSQKWLGDAYKDGDGVVQNLRMAIWWYRKVIDNADGDCWRDAAASSIAEIYGRQGKWLKAAWWRVKAKFYDWAFYWTHFDADDAKALLKKFLIYWPPAIIGVLIVLLLNPSSPIYFRRWIHE